MHLQGVKTAASDMHQTRKWRSRGRKDAAGWCRWGARQRVKDRGNFVEELEVGYEIERTAGVESWIIKLGYRRNDEVLKDMDLDKEDGEEDTAAAEELANCG